MLKPFGKNKNCSLRFVILNWLSGDSLRNNLAFMDMKLKDIEYFINRNKEILKTINNYCEIGEDIRPAAYLDVYVAAGIDDRAIEEKEIAKSTIKDIFNI